MRNQVILFLFVAVLSLVILPEAKAQRILGAMSAGMNLSQVDGDEFYGFHKVGLNVGPSVIIPFGKNRNFSFVLELLYSQKGSVHRGSSDSSRFSISLDYAEIPLLLRITDKKLISGGVGFSYGGLINFKETRNAFFDTLFHSKTPMANNEVSIIGEIQIRLWSKLWANLRYQYSLASLRSVVVDDPRLPRNPFTRKQYNNVISLRLTWVFNQPKVAKGSEIELRNLEE